jgi:hypothetical protein
MVSGRSDHRLLASVSSDCAQTGGATLTNEVFIGKNRNFSINPGEIIGYPEWGSGVSCRRSLKWDLRLTFAVVDIWGFHLMNPY